MIVIHIFRLVILLDLFNHDIVNPISRNLRRTSLLKGISFLIFFIISTVLIAHLELTESVFLCYWRTTCSTDRTYFRSILFLFSLSLNDASFIHFLESKFLFVCFILGSPFSPDLGILTIDVSHSL